ncbi:MAG: hypothetical protein IKF17_00625 [Clostridia bacterium]|nr:hypothetical protein [Clostridia bacterium]
MKKIKLNKRDVVALVIIAIIVISSFIYVSYKQLQYYMFANEMENLYTKNENPIFCIDKIVMYSSANAIDNSEGQTMQDLNICQFTDLAIYIDNMVDINALVKESDAMGVSTEETNDEASRKIKEHTIKELYIDNIKIENSSARGIKTLTYKSPLRFGKFKTADEESKNNNEEVSAEKETLSGEKTPENNEENKQVDEQKNNQGLVFEEQPERIDFEIISNNVDNERNDYTKPTFYADCSNPITLNYMNRDIVTGYSVSAEDTQIKFDGSILQSVGINLADISCSLSFDIHMKNNLDQNFACSVGIDIPLSNENKTIYSGYMYGMQNELQNQYKFFKN